MVDCTIFCRFCLKVTDEKVNCLHSVNLLSTIEDFFGFKISNADKFSTYICSDCYYQLGRLTSFQASVASSQKTIEQWFALKELSAQTIKTEDNNIHVQGRNILINADDNHTQKLNDNPKKNNLPHSLDKTLNQIGFDNRNNNTENSKFKGTVTAPNRTVLKLNLSNEDYNRLLSLPVKSITNVVQTNKSIPIKKSSEQEKKSETNRTSLRKRKQTLNTEGACSAKTMAPNWLRKSDQVKKPIQNCGTNKILNFEGARAFKQRKLIEATTRTHTQVSNTENTENIPVLALYSDSN